VAVGPDAKTRSERHLTRIGNSQHGFLGFVTGRAGIEKIRVLALPVGIGGYRDEMVDVERCAAIIPLLTMKAVYAPKRELIT
jgi:hypothetical protein